MFHPISSLRDFTGQKFSMVILTVAQIVVLAVAQIVALAGVLILILRMAVLHVTYFML